jgi:hypothetical protein
MVSFDLYMQPIANGSARPGDVVELDGIDGFFDQYFEGREVGGIIRFASVSAPDKWPKGVEAMLELPFFSAEIVENYDVSGRVRLREVSTLGEWSLSRDEQPTGLEQLSFPVRMPAELASIVQQALTCGSAYWTTRRVARTVPRISPHSRDVHYWPSLSEVTAIGALGGVDSLGLWVLTTNALPNYFARVTV